MGSREVSISGKLTMDSDSLLSLSTGLSTDSAEVYVFGQDLLDEDFETSANLAGDGRVGVVAGRGANPRRRGQAHLLETSNGPRAHAPDAASAAFCCRAAPLSRRNF